MATYNVYLGADIALLFGATGPDDLRDRVLAVRDQLVATDVVGRTRAVARLLAQERPDLVGLQEVAQWHIATGVSGSPDHEPVRVLAALLVALQEAGTPYDVAVSHQTFRGSARLRGVEASLQGHDVVLVRRDAGVQVRGTGRGSFRRTLDLHAPDGVTMEASRGWGRVDVRLDGVDLRFVSTHTEAWDAEVRDAQRDEVVAAVGEPGAPVVIVGDLNACPEHVGMPPSYVDAWTAGAERGPGHTATQAAGLANETSALDHRIDYVFVRGLEVIDARLVGDRPQDRTPEGLWPSDHAGVVVDLGL